MAAPRKYGADVPESFIQLQRVHGHLCVLRCPAGVMVAASEHDITADMSERALFDGLPAEP